MDYVGKSHNIGVKFFIENHRDELKGLMKTPDIYIARLEEIYLQELGVKNADFSGLIDNSTGEIIRISERIHEKNDSNLDNSDQSFLNSKLQQMESVPLNEIPEWKAIIVSAENEVMQNSDSYGNPDMLLAALSVARNSGELWVEQKLEDEGAINDDGSIDPTVSARINWVCVGEAVGEDVSGYTTPDICGDIGDDLENRVACSVHFSLLAYDACDQ